MFGLGKKRTPLGKWLDRNRWTQEELRAKAKINRDTVSKACNDEDYIPSPRVMKKILKAVREDDPNLTITDFWDM